MFIYVDSEGDPIQEFSALYVNNVTHEIIDLFHCHVKYPFDSEDFDWKARRCVHGLDLEFLKKHGVNGIDELKLLFFKWLETHPYQAMFAHAPSKEKEFLNLTIGNVCLKPWKDRSSLQSHQLAILLKMNFVPICNTTCIAHASFVSWEPKRRLAWTLTDCAKMKFSHHCSLYDCVECFLFHLQ